MCIVPVALMNNDAQGNNDRHEVSFFLAVARAFVMMMVDTTRGRRPAEGNMATESVLNVCIYRVWVYVYI